MMIALAGLPGKLKTILDRISVARMGYVDTLTSISSWTSATNSKVPDAASWTPTRATYLDTILTNTSTAPTTFIQGNIQTVMIDHAAPSTGGTPSSSYYYVDTGITGVSNINKTLVLLQQPSMKYGGIEYIVNMHAYLTSTSVVRLAMSQSNGAPGAPTTLAGRIYIVEFK